MAVDLINLLYAVIISVGGIIGYARKGSVPSLAAGLLCGIVMIFGSIQMGQDAKNVTLSLVTSAILTVVMGYRFSKSGKFVPAGVVTVLR
ncbi:unnamed protein product [Candidula unifasciata]|uniref:Transmembrane protein 14C n=1 Tax=Candidula unifasciata TaxID=100452 RepID=A0A8S3ZHG5_9EUPU|nr:unnamed protein product [Candidula unifasciata]